jgi:hypothetical protein
MGSLPTRRLIDATAKLDPADRALLNLWLNRGFDDQRLATLTGMSPEAVVGRRDRVIGRLSEDLTLPPADVQQALWELASGETTNGSRSLDENAEISSTNGHGTSDRVPETATGLLLGPAAARPEAAAPPEPEERTGSRRRTARLAAALVVLAGIIIAIVLLVTEGSHASHRPRPQAQSAPTAVTPSPSTPAVSTPTTSSSPAPAAAQSKPAAPAPLAFAGLPGGLMHTRGAVQLLGPIKHLKLKLTVRGLPTAHHGHYQVWLFNSVLDSRSLGRLRTGVRAASYRLPSQARRYRWIDVSFQPTGYVNHSGESELRAANPVHTTLKRLRRAASRKRRQLRRARSGSKRASTSK